MLTAENCGCGNSSDGPRAGENMEDIVGREEADAEMDLAPTVVDPLPRM